MRKHSKKQTAASRANGAKSAGPTSADGKQKSRRNALKDGSFSKDVVVTAAGERVEDFKSLKAAVWDSVQPDDALQEMLANDLVVNWWRSRHDRIHRRQTSALEEGMEETLTVHRLRVPAQLCRTLASTNVLSSRPFSIVETVRAT